VRSNPHKSFLPLGFICIFFKPKSPFSAHRPTRLSVFLKLHDVISQFFGVAGLMEQSGPAIKHDLRQAAG
jgi:hypothetical protein